MFPLVPTRRARRLGRRGAARMDRSVKAALKAGQKAAVAAARQADTMARAIADQVAGRVADPVSRPAPGRPPRPRGRFVLVDGLRVHVIVRGRGRPVVLIHGNGARAEDFAVCGLIDRLAERYRVIAIDRPGFGRTDRPRHRIWTASAQAALLQGVLDRLKVERPLLVGHSWGTLVALAMAQEAGQAWGQATGRAPRGLVLLSGYYFPEQRADVSLAGPLALPGLGDAARALVPGPVNRALAAQSVQRVFWPQPVPARFSAAFPVEEAVGATLLRAASEDAATMNAAAGRLQGGYPRLDLPVAIVTGAADAIVSPATQSMRLHRVLPRSTLAVLPGQGHMIHYGARATLVRVIDTMMTPTPRRSPGPRVPDFPPAR